MTDPGTEPPWNACRPGSTGQRADTTGGQGGSDQSISRLTSRRTRRGPNMPAQPERFIAAPPLWSATEHSNRPILTSPWWHRTGLSSA